MVDSRRDATHPCPIVGHGRSLRCFTGFAVPDRRADAGVADGVLLGGDSAAAMGVIKGQSRRKAADHSPECLVGISVRIRLVSGELLLDLSDDVFVWRSG